MGSGKMAADSIPPACAVTAGCGRLDETCACAPHLHQRPLTPVRLTNPLLFRRRQAGMKLKVYVPIIRTYPLNVLPDEARMAKHVKGYFSKPTIFI